MLKKAVIWIIILAALGSGAYFFYFKDYRANLLATKKEAPRPLPPSVVSADIVKNSSKIIFPNISTSTVVKTDSIPKEIGKAVLPLAVNVKVEKLKYEDGSTGFQITYLAPLGVETAYEQLTTAMLSWKSLSGSRAERAAMLEFRSDKYSARMVLEAVQDAGSTKIIVQTK